MLLRAMRQSVANVVEMNYFLEILEIAVMSVSLHEVRIGTLIHVAKRGNLVLAHCFPRAAHIVALFGGIRIIPYRPS